MIPLSIVKAAASEASEFLEEEKRHGEKLYNRAMAAVGVPSAAHANANPVYELINALSGGKTRKNSAGDSLYSWDRIKDTEAMNKLNEIAEMIRNDKAGTALKTAISPLAKGLAVASPVVGAISGAVGDAGMLRGALRGLGFGAGGLAGTAAGAILADKLAGTASVKSMSPAMQAIITAMTTLGSGALGSYFGHTAARALSRSDREEYEDAIRERHGL